MLSVLTCSLDGHNEAEFGMSWCAGFGASFYNSYFEVNIDSSYMVTRIHNLIQFRIRYCVN
jgi:hypothetical protein